MICSSVQTGIECPGLPFGLADVPAGWRRRVLQVAVAVLSPITVLLLRLQFQLTQKGFRVTSLEQMSLVEFSYKYRIVASRSTSRLLTPHVTN